VDPELPSGLPFDPAGTVVTVGTFDGMHRGHWAVLQEIRRRAVATGRRSVLLTFDPHPLTVVRPDRAPLMLTTATEKKEILAESGLDFAVFLRFTQVLAAYPPERFVEEILVRRLGVSELVVGHDHHFGRGRAGDAEMLQTIGAERGFTVDVVGPVGGDSGDSPVSSTRIREAISQGDLRAAAAGLGRVYSMRGTVVRGEGRGHELGFPTANLRIQGERKLVPPPGIYAARGVLRRGTYEGALHIGPRPTFPGSPPAVELHLMDFEGDLYGEELRVDLVERLRDVLPFATVQGLIDQMQADVRRARDVLSREPALS